VPEVPEGMPSAEDALAFLQSFAVGKEEELRAQAEAEGESRMEAIMGGKPGTSPLRPKPEAAPVEEVPEAILGADENLAFLEGLAIEAPPEMIAEAPVEEALVVSDYWLQTADDEGAEPISPDYFAPKPPVEVMPKARAKAKAPARPAEPEPVAVPATPPIGAEEFLARLQVDPNDREALLGVARVWWAAGDRMQSLKSYQQLLEHEVFLQEVAADLTRNLESYEDAAWYRALGDTHMKLGNLSSALEAYRQALTHL
jgi:hypothetical protein